MFFLFFFSASALRFQDAGINSTNLKAEVDLEEANQVSESWCMQFPYCPSGCNMFCKPEDIPHPPVSIPKVAGSRIGGHMHKKHHHHHRRRKSAVDTSFISKFVMEFAKDKVPGAKKGADEAALKAALVVLSNNKIFLASLVSALAVKFSLTAAQAKTQIELIVNAQSGGSAFLELVSKKATKFQLHVTGSYDISSVNKAILLKTGFNDEYKTELVKQYETASAKDGVKITLDCTLDAPKQISNKKIVSVSEVVIKLAFTLGKLPPGKDAEKLSKDKDFRKQVIAGLAKHLKIDIKTATAKLVSLEIKITKKGGSFSLLEGGNVVIYVMETLAKLASTPAMKIPTANVVAEQVKSIKQAVAKKEAAMKEQGELEKIAKAKALAEFNLNTALEQKKSDVSDKKDELAKAITAKNADSIKKLTAEVASLDELLDSTKAEVDKAAIAVVTAEKKITEAKLAVAAAETERSNEVADAFGGFLTGFVAESTRQVKEVVKELKDKVSELLAETVARKKENDAAADSLAEKEGDVTTKAQEVKDAKEAKEPDNKAIKILEDALVGLKELIVTQKEIVKKKSRCLFVGQSGTNTR